MSDPTENVLPFGSEMCVDTGSFIGKIIFENDNLTFIWPKLVMIHAKFNKKSTHTQDDISII